jgi:hypothetical protein
MSSETKKPYRSMAGCAEFGHMSGMYTNMMKMMGNCCPGMKEKFSDKENMQAMMEKCCGTMVNQKETSTSSQNESERKKKKKGANKCCS